MYRRWIAASSVSSVLLAGLALVPVAPAVAAKPRHVADVTSRPDSVSAQLAARTTGHRVMDLSQSTVLGNVYANPNGTWTSTTATGPVQVKDSRGDWHGIDSTLTVGKDGRLREKWALDDATFSAGGDSTVATMSSQGVPSTWSWPTKLPKPTIVGNVVTYKIGSGENLVVTADGTGFTEDVVLTKRPTSAQNLVLPMQARGASISRTSNGLEVRNRKGKSAMFVPKPFAYDSSKNSGGDPKLGALDTAVAPDGSLTLSPDPTFLSDPKTVYPVTIDPGFTIYNGNDTWVQYPDYTSSQYSSTEDKAGTYDGGGHIARTFLGFPQTNFVGRHILSASLVMDNWYSGSCTAGNVYAWQITSNWSSTALTWGAQPSISSSNDVAYSPAHGYSSSCPEGNATWNITAMAQAWSNGAARDGIELRAGSETNIYSWRRYRSSNYATTSKRPYITATFNSYPGTPTAPTVSQVSSYTPPGGTAANYTSNNKPTYSTVVSDADGGTVRAGIYIYTSPTGSLVTSCTTPYVASGTTASCTPSYTLSNATYYVKAKAYDGTDDGLSYSSWSPFTVASGTPAAPVITCPPYTNNSWTTPPPSSPVSCTISAAGSGTPAPGKISYTIDGTTTIATITQSTDPNVAKVNVTVSNVSGLHAISATAISPAGVSSTASSLQFGYGSVNINSPLPTYPMQVVDNVAIQASGPPPTSGQNPTAQLQWRQAGTGTWTAATATAPLSLVNSNGQLSISGTWDSTSDLKAAGLDLTAPQLVDVQICVTYSSTQIQCSSTAATTQVLHVEHAFGGNFPTTDVSGGQVALSTGEFTTTRTDAKLAAGTTSLSIGRTHYTTQATSTSPVDDVFGPGWIADLPAQSGHADAQVTDSTVKQGVIAVLQADGTPLLFQPPADANGVTKAPRDSNGNFTTGAWQPVDATTRDSGVSAQFVSTTDQSKKNNLILTDVDGTTTTFAPTTAPGVGTPAAFLNPGTVAPAPSAATTSYQYDGSGRVTRILAPVPSGVDCSTSMNLGCRALDISYATSTTATTASAGDYNGQVKTIATDIGGTTTVVAQYAYDTSGRLVSVADPRPVPALTTTYGYDGTSYRIASIAEPGQTPINYAYNAAAQLVQVTRTRDTNDSPVGTADLATIVYGIPTAGSAATAIGLPDLSAGAIAAWSQPVAPTYGVAVFGSSHPFATVPTSSSLTSGDGAFASTYYTDTQGDTLNTGLYGAGQWLLTDTEYDVLGNPVRQLSALDVSAIEDGRLKSVDAGALTVYNSQHTDPSSGAVTLVADSEKTDSFTTARWVTLANGSVVWARQHTNTKYDEGAPNGNINPTTSQEYGLVTTVTTGVADPSKVLTQAGSTEPADLEINSMVHTGYANAIPGGDVNAGWNQGLASTHSVVMNNSVAGGTAGAAAITKTIGFNALGQTTAVEQPMSNGTDAGTRKSVYYQAGTGSGASVCDNHAELQGVLCQTSFAGDPASGPGMITRTYGYNPLQEPTTITEASGATTRTTTITYDAAGRKIRTSVNMAGLSGSTPVPDISYGYDPSTGLSTTTSAAAGANGGTITIGYDAWGRPDSYSNSTGTTTSTYDSAGNQAKLTAADGTVTTYTTDGADATGAMEHRGLLTSLSATGHGATTTISAAYDAAGSVALEKYGSGVSLTNSYDTVGDLIGRVYSGDITDPSTGIVTPNSPWIGWTQTIDSAGRVAAEWTPDGGATTGDTTGAAATGFSDAYTYDPAGRLTAVVDQTVPAGVGGIDASTGAVTGGACTIRTYSFDANGNRTAKTVIPSNADGSCQSISSPTGATTALWSHDSADRITNTGYVYDNLGRTTSVPQADTPLAQAGGSPGTLTLSYFDTDQIQAQTQNGSSLVATLDASGRPLTESTGPTGGVATSTTTLGYTSPTDAASFETTVSGGTTTSEAYVNGPDGLLGATLTSNGVAQLAVSDPRGSVAAQITLPPAGDAAGLDDWSASDEYGNPVNQTTAGTTATNPAGDATGGLGYGWEGARQRVTGSTGLVRMGARLYNPVTGSFTSVDPIRGGNATAYGYPTDPINSSDISGAITWRNYHVYAQPAWYEDGGELAGHYLWSSWDDNLWGYLIPAMYWYDPLGYISFYRIYYKVTYEWQEAAVRNSNGIGTHEIYRLLSDTLTYAFARWKEWHGWSPAYWVYIPGHEKIRQIAESNQRIPTSA